MHVYQFFANGDGDPTVPIYQREPSCPIKAATTQDAFDIAEGLYPQGGGLYLAGVKVRDVPNRLVPDTAQTVFVLDPDTLGAK
jgi:hypothetical protein